MIATIISKWHLGKLCCVVLLVEVVVVVVVSVVVDMLDAVAAVVAEVAAVLLLSASAASCIGERDAGFLAATPTRYRGFCPTSLRAGNACRISALDKHRSSSRRAR